jgi:hypothetical protein
MENGLDAELDTELGYSKYDYRNKETDNSPTVIVARPFGPVSVMWRFLYPEIVKASLNLNY